MEKLLTFTAIGLALIALFRQPQQTVVESGGSNALPSISLGNGPTFNIQGAQTNDAYQGGAYPPFNSCGCGRASTGVRLALSLSPVYGAASQSIPGVPLSNAAIAEKQSVREENVNLISNGVYV